MMERSTRFLSLSGWAGIFPGILALTGIAVSIWLIDQSKSTGWYEDGVDRNSPLAIQLAATAIIVLLLSLFSSWYMCMRKARLFKESTWTPAIKNMLIHMSVPLMAGTITAAWIYQMEYWRILPTVMLAFYGLALVQVSHFTLKSVFWLGIIEIALSFFAAVEGWGFPVLAIGFGFAHIIYGLIQFSPRSPDTAII